MKQRQMIVRLRAALPAVREWIDSTVSRSRTGATPVSRLGYDRLHDHLPRSFLDRVRVIAVDRVPFPPLSALGLPELGAMERMPLLGITFRDTVFVRRSDLTESLVFHELVHVIQWDRLGVDNFLLAYGVGLLQLGYDASPLERIAYLMESSFERDAVPPDVVAVVNEQADNVWKQVERLLGES